MPPRTAQEARDLPVDRGQTLSNVEQQHDHLGLVDGDLGLRLDRGARFVLGGIEVETRGVDDGELTAAPFGHAIKSIAGESGLRIHDGLSPTQDAIEKSRFAHVGATDYSNDGARHMVNYTGMRRFTVEDRRARLVRRHHLATGAQVASAVQVARDLVGLHATDPSTVFLAAAARMGAPHVEAIEQELYERRSLVRMLGMRRTMWVLPLELASVVQAACTRSIALRERLVLVRILEEAGVPD